MELYQHQLIETLVVLCFYFIAKNVFIKLIDRTLSGQQLMQSRGIVMKKVLNFVLLSLCFLFILLIWGVKQSDLAVFMGSILTIVGVAFFAQWSLLSNITSSIILFFNHPIRMYDSISIMEGKVVNIGIFFITLQTESGEELTLPNNVFIQKSIKKKNSGVQVEQIDKPAA